MRHGHSKCPEHFRACLRACRRTCFWSGFAWFCMVLPGIRGVALQGPQASVHTFHPGAGQGAWHTPCSEADREPGSERQANCIRLCTSTHVYTTSHSGHWTSGKPGQADDEVCHGRRGRVHVEQCGAAVRGRERTLLSLRPGEAEQAEQDIPLPPMSILRLPKEIRKTQRRPCDKLRQGGFRGAGREGHAEGWHGVCHARERQAGARQGAGQGAGQQASQCDTRRH